MQALLKSWIVRALALAMVASAAFAQDRVPFRQEELDQMLAPIALYPDPLLSQILMASTYPLEVVEASRWSRANPGLKGQDAVRAVEPMNWDPSVKSLTAFPQVLAMLDSKLEWTESLGEAFIGQQEDVMNTVQGLRRKAEAAGNLLSSDQMRVARSGDYITLAPPAPEVVYVPYYDPMVAYGPWWYPAYPPVYWAPPAYCVGPAYRPGFYWGSGIAISATFFFGHTDWHRHRVTVVNNTVNNVTVVNRTMINAPSRSRTVVWQPDPAHRRGAPFHHAAARQRFEQSRAAAPAVAAPSARGAAPTPSAAARRQTGSEHGNAARERHDAPPPRAASATNSSNRSSISPNVGREVQSSQPNVIQGRRASPPASRPAEHHQAPRPQARVPEPPRAAIAAPQVQPAPQSVPSRAEARGSANHGAERREPARASGPHRQAAPRANGHQQDSDRGGRRRDG